MDLRKQEIISGGLTGFIGFWLFLILDKVGLLKNFKSNIPMDVIVVATGILLYELILKLIINYNNRRNDKSSEKN